MKEVKITYQTLKYDGRSYNLNAAQIIFNGTLEDVLSKMTRGWVIVANEKDTGRFVLYPHMIQEMVEYDKIYDGETQRLG